MMSTIKHLVSDVCSFAGSVPASIRSGFGAYRYLRADPERAFRFSLHTALSNARRTMSYQWRHRPCLQHRCLNHRCNNRRAMNEITKAIGRLSDETMVEAVARLVDHRP